MNHHKKGKHLVVGAVLVICLSIASYGFWLTQFAPEEVWDCTSHLAKNPNDRPHSGIEVQDRMIHLFPHSANSSTIRYLWFDLITNTSLFPEGSYFMSYDFSHLGNEIFSMNLHSEDGSLSPVKYPSEEDLTDQLGRYYDRKDRINTVTVSWIERCEEINSDKYLDAAERLRIYVVIGDNLIEWGDTLTISIASLDGSTRTHMTLVIGLPAEMPLQGNSFLGEYTKCSTRFS